MKKYIPVLFVILVCYSIAYSASFPTVGGSEDTWGDELRTFFSPYFDLSTGLTVSGSIPNSALQQITDTGKLPQDISATGSPTFNNVTVNGLTANTISAPSILGTSIGAGTLSTNSLTATGALSGASLSVSGAISAGSMSISSFTAATLNGTNGVFSGTLRTADIIANGPWLDSRAFGSLAAAEAQAYSTGQTLLISQPYSISSSTFIRSNTIIAGGGLITLSSGVTVTISGPFSAPLQRVFNNNGGTITLTNVPEAYPQWWYDGGGDWGPSISNAIGSMPSPRTLVSFVSGSYPVTTTINLPLGIKKFKGYGYAHLYTTGTNTIFWQTNSHAAGQSYDIFEGLSFTGGGTAIGFNRQDAADYFSSDASINDCRFSMNSGVYGVWLQAIREPIIKDSWFDNAHQGNGVYMTESTFGVIWNTKFSGSDYSGTALRHDGNYSAWSAGPYIIGCEIMGWDRGVYLEGIDDLWITGSTIDYNAQAMRLVNTDGGKITNNYLGQSHLNSNPALELVSDATATCLYPGTARCNPSFFLSNLKISGNDFVAHNIQGKPFSTCSTTDTVNGIKNGDVDLIVVNGCQGCSISDNSISFYNRYGIRLSGYNANSIIKGNYIIANPVNYYPTECYLSGGTYTCTPGFDIHSSTTCTNQTRGVDGIYVDAYSRFTSTGLYTGVSATTNNLSDNSILIHQNLLANWIDKATIGSWPSVSSINAQLWQNRGFVTENGGQEYFGIVTSVTVTHSLDVTPKAGEITLTVDQGGGGAYSLIHMPYVSATNSTSFTVSQLSTNGTSTATSLNAEPFYFNWKYLRRIF